MKGHCKTYFLHETDTVQIPSHIHTFLALVEVQSGLQGRDKEEEDRPGTLCIGIQSHNSSWSDRDLAMQYTLCRKKKTSITLSWRACKTSVKLSLAGCCRDCLT